MATYYVGIGGDDGNNGTTWALRKLTLNGAENIPVAAGDTVYVGAGTYRELLALDVSGSAGNPITYAGDYLGTNTDGVGGVVRITGSDDDATVARANCIYDGGGRDYRTFQGFVLDTATTPVTANGNQCTNWIIQNCVLYGLGTTNCIVANGQSNTWTIQNCLFYVSDAYGFYASYSSTYNDAAITIQNCIFLSGGVGVVSNRVGGVTVKNCTFHTRIGIRIETALAGGQTLAVNNCIFAYENIALYGTSTAEIIENYNTFWGNATNRTNTNTGANSVVYPPLFDTRWFFQLCYAGAGAYSPLQVVSPFDLASYSQLVNLAGTSPTTTDIRGTGTLGAQREWGALEYDSTLKILGGITKSRTAEGQ